jgi:hypothetical protein
MAQSPTPRARKHSGQTAAELAVNCPNKSGAYVLSDLV